MQNPFGDWTQGRSATPSIYGALPYPTIPTPPQLVTFHIASFAPTILNSTVLGPQNQICFYIVTDDRVPGYTVFRDPSNRNLGLIEWKSPPMVEVRDAVSKQSVRDWLRLSPDQNSRSMRVHGQRFTWAPRDKSIYLWSGSSTNPAFTARLTRNSNSVLLELTPSAVQSGLFETIVAASVLLLCGRNID